MNGTRRMSQSRSWWLLAILGLCLLGSMTVASVATAQGAGSICTIRIFGNGDLLSVFTMPPTNFAITAFVPTDTDVLIPALCDDLSLIGLGVASQEKNKSVTFNVRVFDHKGIMFCNKGGFTVPPPGAGQV